jgi:hypothetical protein
MSDPRHPAVPPLDAADPRISEWLDGRLPAAEAAAVERAVGESPELSAVVADLKKIRAGLRSQPATAVPARFSDRVMDGVRAGGRPALPAAHVPAASESAAGDAARSRPRQRFPWAVLATALAAGLLVAVVLNLSEPADRQVAMAPADNEDLDVWLPTERESARAGPPSPAAPPLAAAARDGADKVALEADGIAANGLRNRTSEFGEEFEAGNAVEAGSDRTISAAPAEAMAKAAADSSEGAVRRIQLPPVPAGLVVIAIDGPEERLAIERLVAASGLDVASVAGRIELTGQAAVIDAFLARLEQDGWVAGPRAARGRAAGESAAGDLAARKLARDEARADDRRQLILRLVDRRPPPQPPETKPAAETDSDQP